MAPSQLLPVLATPKIQMDLGRTGHFATDDPYLESQVCPHVFGHIQHRALL
jgi:hypothetical protein